MKIEWKGGQCPVSGDTMVKVFFENGDTDVVSADNYFWEHRYSHNGRNIIAYEVIEEAKEEPKQIIEKTLWDEYALAWMKARDWDNISIAAAVDECEEVANEMMKARAK